MSRRPQIRDGRGGGIREGDANPLRSSTGAWSESLKLGKTMNWVLFGGCTLRANCCTHSIAYCCISAAQGAALHGSSNQSREQATYECRPNVGPASATLAQHWSGIYTSPVYHHPRASKLLTKNTLQYLSTATAQVGPIGRPYYMPPVAIQWDVYSEFPPFAFPDPSVDGKRKLSRRSWTRGVPLSRCHIPVSTTDVDTTFAIHNVPQLECLRFLINMLINSLAFSLGTHHVKCLG